MTHDEIRAAAQTYLKAEHDERFSSEVRALLDSDDPAEMDELADRFYTDLEFGTGGLRGVIGGGFNRMNPFVIARATTGLARYVAAHGDAAADGTRSAVLCYDNRRYSREFALSAALVFAAHGIRAYLFSRLRPTPQLSFAVRHYGAATGVMVTASHNPPQYNGYKVFWSDGAQIVEPHDSGIIDEVMSVDPTSIRIMDEGEAREQGLLVDVGSEMDDLFVAMVSRQSVQPALLRERGSEVTAVYTPLHGTGAPMVERVLGELGVKVITVPEQREPDGEFSTVESPNPEDASALEMALALGREKDADIVLGTDPDADRLGIAVPDGDEWVLVTGNQLGVLLIDYIVGQRKALGTLPPDPVVVTTIVTTGLQRLVAESYGATVYETLTGFKYIAGIIRRLEASPGTGSFVMGDEESYGYLIGTEVRDKDAITAVLLTVEMALHWRGQGLTVMDRLRQIWKQFGYWEERTISKYFEGQSGKETMAGLMTSLRESPPKSIAGRRVVQMVDFQRDTVIDPATGKQSAGPGLPSSNVLQYELEGGSRVSARPSGTEPKIKFYASCSAAVTGELVEAQQAVREDIDAIGRDIQRLIEGAAQ